MKMGNPQKNFFYIKLKLKDLKKKNFLMLILANFLNKSFFKYYFFSYKFS